MKKHQLVQRGFHLVQKRYLRRAFAHMDVLVEPPRAPVLIVVNHSCFYDSLVLFELERRALLPPNVIAVMHAEGLRKHKIFGGLGVVPVSSPVKLSEFKQLVRVMDGANLLIFPQGKEEHLEKRPLTIEKGAAALLAKQPAHGVLFISLYYSYGEQPKGQIACSLRYVQADDRPQAVQELHAFLTARMTHYLDELRAEVIAGNLQDAVRLW